jgi:NtrC-family two-component system sensor histidine kinase KinB
MAVTSSLISVSLDESLAARDHHQQIMQGVIDSLPDAVLIVDAGGTVHLLNQIARHRFGLSVGGKIEASGFPKLAEIVSRVVASGEPLRACRRQNVIQFTDRAEEQFFVPTAFPVTTECGLLSRVVLTLIDVTRSRRVDEWNRGAVALFSHELRTPLTSLHMTLGMLENGMFGPPNSKQGILLRAAATDLERLTRTVEDAISSAGEPHAE